MSDTQAKATPIDLEGMSDEQCRKILDAIETARTLGFRYGHSSARREAVNGHDKLLEALKRLGSAEGFTTIGVIPNNNWGDEIKARIDFARAAIQPKSKKIKTK